MKVYPYSMSSFATKEELYKDKSEFYFQQYQKLYNTMYSLADPTVMRLIDELEND